MLLPVPLRRYAGMNALRFWSAGLSYSASAVFVRGFCLRFLSEVFVSGFCMIFLYDVFVCLFCFKFL